MQKCPIVCKKTRVDGSLKNLQVIVKFISKARIVSDCWVDDPMLGRVSQEVAILTRVQHHNIVKVTVDDAVTRLSRNKRFNSDVSYKCVCVTRCWRCLRMGVTFRW